MVHILCLLGRAGHGKTTIARHLVNKYGAKVESLAAPLKRTAMAVMGFGHAQVYGSQEEKEAIDPNGARDAKGNLLSARSFLQKLGTEGLRENFSENIHLDALVSRIREDFANMSHPSDDPEGAEDFVYIVDDVRFPNEVCYLNDLDTESTFVIKLVCTDAPPSGNDNHPSERGIDEVPAEEIAATVISSRALGEQDLIDKFEWQLNNLKALKIALESCRRSRQAVAA